MNSGILLKDRPKPLQLFCLLAAVALAFSSAQSIAADNLIKIPKSALEDITVDANLGRVYFEADGKRYLYQVVTETQPATLAEFVEMMGKAQYLLTGKAYVQRNTDYYDGRVAIELERILIGFGKAERLRD